MKPDRIKPFVSCLLGQLKENTEGPWGWGSQQDGLCIHLINQLAEGKEGREVHVINTCFSLAFPPPQRQSLNGDPTRAPSHLTLDVLEAGASQAAAVTLLAPLHSLKGH